VVAAFKAHGTHDQGPLSHEPDKMTATGIAVGANKGHVVTKRDLAPRASRRKGVRI
jgi:hypothetical protein